MDVDTPEVAGDAVVGHEVRITSQGKIRKWVEHALDFLEKNPNSHLTLHTLPHTKTAAIPQEGPSTSQDAPEAKKADKLPPSITTIPRLISVAEIIKREYIKKLNPANSERGSLLGLHQYNEIGNLDEPGSMTDDVPSQEEARRNAIMLALQGKNHLRQKRVAYMKITLSRNEIPALSSTGATHQKPSARKLSKSARTRLKRRLNQDAVEG